MAAGDIQKCQSQLDERWQLVTSLPKTHQTHCVEPVFKYVVSASMYSTAEQFELVSLHPECHVSSLECQNTASPAPAERPRSDSQPQVHPGDFVTVQYVTKKSKKLIVGQVTQIVDDGCLQASFLRKAGLSDLAYIHSQRWKINPGLIPTKSSDSFFSHPSTIAIIMPLLNVLWETEPFAGQSCEVL